MTHQYRPRRNSVAQRALELLRTFPPGTEFETADLCKRLDVKSDSLATLLAPAVRGGAIAKREGTAAGVRRPTLWRLGDGQRIGPATPPRRKPPPKPDVAARRVNFRVNADVPSHAVRLSEMRHPDAPKPPTAEPVITPATRITYGPSYTHDPRVQCAPGEQPFGAGFAAAGIGRDVATGRAWR